MKYCYECNATNPRTEFNRNRAKTDGLRDECRECYREATRRNVAAGQALLADFAAKENLEHLTKSDIAIGWAVSHRTYLTNFSKYVDRSGDCWRWAASANKGGYGQFTITAYGSILAKVLAHRLAYAEHCWQNDLPFPWSSRRSSPEALTVDHTCRTKLCVNPAHLEPVTNEENIRRRFLAPDEHMTQRAS